MVPPATLIEDLKFERRDGTIIQIKIWRLPSTSPERPHGLKYSLFFGRASERIVAYDNEAGKGDHRHHRDIEVAYAFTTMEQLLADFWIDVRKASADE